MEPLRKGAQGRLMREYRFVTLDVFTDRRFGGNPLAVFPEAEGLTDAEMQSLTREFNLSETTFVLPPQDPANTARVRIFCPGFEMPFAGHPLVGTGTVLAERHPERSELTLEVPAGLVKVRIERGGDGRVASAVIAAPQPLSFGRDLPAADIAACCGLAESDFVLAGHRPVVASVGNPFIIAEITGEALTRARPDHGAFRLAAAKLGMEDRFDIHLYAHAGPGRLRARMFAPLAGIPEDPATGSANAPLAALLLSLGNDAEGSWQVMQGVEMGRPSLLHVAAHREGDVIRATVGGGSVAMLEGSVRL
jgi:trans-2,3-dihydro-3-hydroxyanthranilate isomerase